MSFTVNYKNPFARRFQDINNEYDRQQMKWQKKVVDNFVTSAEQSNRDYISLGDVESFKFEGLLADFSASLQSYASNATGEAPLIGGVQGIEKTYNKLMAYLNLVMKYNNLTLEKQQYVQQKLDELLPLIQNNINWGEVNKIGNDSTEYSNTLVLLQYIENEIKNRTYKLAPLGLMINKDKFSFNQINNNVVDMIENVQIWLDDLDNYPENQTNRNLKMNVQNYLHRLQGFERLINLAIREKNIEQGRDLYVQAANVFSNARYAVETLFDLRYEQDEIVDEGDLEQDEIVDEGDLEQEAIGGIPDDEEPEIQDDVYVPIAPNPINLTDDELNYLKELRMQSRQIVQNLRGEEKREALIGLRENLLTYGANSNLKTDILDFIDQQLNNIEGAGRKKKVTSKKVTSKKVTSKLLAKK